LERRLAAILASDVAGYSKLMASDESRALAALKRHRQEHFAPEVNRHGGRIVKFMGDGALVEFSSAVNAVEAAIAIQNQALALQDDPIRLRIGINLGDVVVEENDIYGDGVNIAARIEPHAPVGGVCVSENVFDQIKGKIEIEFQDQGEHELKNIPWPVRIYSWAPQSATSRSDIQPKADDGRTSIAVLPFDNMSADAAQEFFVDGVTEDIITELSRFNELLVIARNTTFIYKGKPIDVSDVGAKLGVRYVVEGSVRKSGNRIRITAQLIDAATGAHIWADRIDRNFDDIFAVQDDITSAIISAVAPTAIEADAAKARAKRPEDLNSWELVHQARWHASKATRAGLFEAMALLEQAIERDPTFSRAYTDLGLYTIHGGIFTWLDRSMQENCNIAAELARTALQYDSNNAHAETLLGYAMLMNRQYEASRAHCDSALRINPNLAIGHANLSLLHTFCGEYDKAKFHYRRALRLSPRDPLRVRWNAGLAEGALLAGQLDEAVELLKQGVLVNPDNPLLYRTGAVVHSELGDFDEARRQIALVRRFMPKMTIATCREAWPIKDVATRERFLEVLKNAGLPE
jgi:adenylate cyclase